MGPLFVTKRAFVFYVVFASTLMIKGLYHRGFSYFIRRPAYPFLIIPSKILMVFTRLLCFLNPVKKPAYLFNNFAG
jgi:hypothetical protein